MKVAIIGGGVSGMFLASMLKTNKDTSITLFEKNNKLGKKLLLTGNGKCNFTNDDFLDLNKIYNNDFARHVYYKNDKDSFLDYMIGLGIMPKKEIHREKVYYYPTSNKASSVYYNLYDKIISNNIRILLNANVIDLKYSDNNFVVKFISNNITHSDNYDVVVIATGGKSYKNTGSDGNFYNVIKKYGHKIVEPMPGLTSLIINDEQLKKINGVRIDTLVYYNKIYSEIGEVQFNNGYISGIPILNLTSRIARKIKKDELQNITFNFLYNFDKNVLYDRKKNLTYKKVRDFLCGLISDEITNVLYSRISIDTAKYVKNLTDMELDLIYRHLTRFSVNVLYDYDFSKAQITLGGFDVNMIDKDTMESKIIKGLYFAGECIDIDGICGGYNIQLCYGTARSIYNKLISM